MNSVRAFIISSSMFLTLWLAASYATQLEQPPIASSAQQTPASSHMSPVSTVTKTTTEPGKKQNPETLAQIK